MLLESPEIDWGGAIFGERVHKIDQYKSLNGIIPNYKFRLIYVMVMCMVLRLETLNTPFSILMKNSMAYSTLDPYKYNLLEHIAKTNGTKALKRG